MAGNSRQKTLSFGAFSMWVSQIVDFGATVGAKTQAKSEGKAIKSPLKGINFKLDKVSKIIELIKKHRILSGLSIIFVLIAALLVFKLSTSGQSSLPLVGGQTNFSPTQQVAVNRKFGIPIRTAKGETTGNSLGFTLTTVDRAKRILIQGKPATSRDTKTFVILNFEIENSTNDQLTIRPVDLIRLVDAQNRSFAPDVHNNEVIAEPISIKRTRVGFVVNEDQNYFKFTIGEINGAKETIEVTI